MNLDIDKVIDLLKADGVEAMKLTGESSEANIKRITSGSQSIDDAIGGGWPKGRLIEIFGPESYGKTTVCLHAVKEFQSAGNIVAFIDVEHAFDASYAKAIGVDVDKIIFFQPSSAEESTKAVKSMIRRGVKLVIVDSIAGMATEQELLGQDGDANIGSLARLLSQQLKQIATVASTNDATVIFTNQMREKPGVMFGSPEYQPGGKAIKYYASIRVDVRRDGAPAEGEVMTKIKVVKNKTSPPFRKAAFKIRFGVGIDESEELLKKMIDVGLISKSGSVYRFKGNQIMEKGLDGALNFVRKIGRQKISQLIESCRKPSQ